MPTIRKIKRFGWKPSAPDPRDRRLRHTRGQLLRAVPRVFSLREKMPKIYQQRALGSCTAQAVGGVFEYREKNDANLSRLIVPSRLFIYYNTRSLNGETRVDSGASLRDTIKAVAVWGAPDEAIWPYVISRYAKKPPREAYDQAILYQAVKYARVEQTMVDIKACIFDGHPVVFGASVFPSFESTKVVRTGVVPMPKAAEPCVGGHAQVIIGWSDARGAFEVRNSYGASWGDQGHCWMPYGYITNRNLCDDFWILQEIEP